MGKNGGARPGAGRKALDERKTGKHVRAASSGYDLAQPKALKALLEALDATKKVPIISGRDEKGKPTYDYIDQPDHYVRVKAAIAIAAKRIPDVARKEHTGEGGGPIDVKTTNFDPREMTDEQLDNFLAEKASRESQRKKG